MKFKRQWGKQNRGALWRQQKGGARRARAKRLPPLDMFARGFFMRHLLTDACLRDFRDSQRFAQRVYEEWQRYNPQLAAYWKGAETGPTVKSGGTPDIMISSAGRIIGADFTLKSTGQHDD